MPNTACYINDDVMLTISIFSEIVLKLLYQILTRDQVAFAFANRFRDSGRAKPFLENTFSALLRR